MKLIDLVQLFRIHPRAPVIFLRPYWDKLWRVLYVGARLYRALLLRRTKVITVVGSLGKTTTTRALQSLLVPKPRAASYSNYGSSLAANLLCCRPADRWWVLEVGISGPGQMARYARMLRPDVVVVTSVKSEHSRSFGTLERTRAEKVNMVKALSPEGLAILNGDDPHVRWMASQTPARVVTFGLAESNAVRASNVDVDWPHGTRFVVHAAGEDHALRIPLIGAHHVYSALAAIAVGLEAGIGWSALAEHLGSLKAAPGRIEPVRLDCGAIVLDDSHKGALESFVTSLEVLSSIPAVRRIAVLSDVDESSGRVGDLYRDLGDRVSRAADQVIFVGSQNFGKLKTGATRAGMEPSSLVYVGSSVREATEVLRAALSADTVVLLKGAGRRRLRRVTLALLNRDVRCTARNCTAKVPTCDVCPLLNRDESVFENAFIRRYVQ